MQTNNIFFRDDDSAAHIICYCGCHEHGGLHFEDETYHELKISDADEAGLSLSLHANFGNAPRKERIKLAFDVLFGRSIYLDIEIDQEATEKLGNWMLRRYAKMVETTKKWQAEWMAKAAAKKEGK